MTQTLPNIQIQCTNSIVDNQELPVFYQTRNVKFFYFNNICIPFSIHQSYFLKKCRVEFYPLKDGQRLTEKEEENVLNRFAAFIKENKIADRIVQGPNYAIFKTFPKGAVYCNFGTYKIDLLLSDEVLWKKIHSKHKNVIRNAEKNAVQLRYGLDQIETFYMLYKQTMERSQMYCEDLTFFKKMCEELPNNIICGVAYFQNVPQGGLYIPFTNYAAYYLYGASSDNLKINGSITYLHWNTIKILKTKGVKTYDFVGARLSEITGTRLEGIQKFKLRFGAELDKGFLWKMDINVLRCRLYDALLNIKQKTLSSRFRKDIIDQENDKKENITNF